MNKRFEKNLPEGFKEIFVVDATEKKFIIFMNIANLLIVLGLLIPYFISNSESITYIIDKITRSFKGLIYPISFLIGMIVYVILHELIHGIAYKVLTKEKLTFGITLTVAYCGVPNIYVYRKPALIALLAPFTVFTILFLTLYFVIPDMGFKLIIYFIFALHIGGCIGDLYDTFLYLTKFRDNEILMKDTGPKQVFYRRK